MTPAASATGYFAHVDGLRALAVLAVMLYHLNPALLPGGFVGVDVFFVISGFVVTASLAGHRAESAADFFGQFYARRLARLVPALVTMLVATTALYVLFVPKAWFNRAAETVGQAAFWGLSNWALDRQVVNYFEPRAELNPFTHTWSLGVEEQFYLIAPLLLFTVLANRVAPGARRLALVALAALAAVSLLACYAYGFARGSRFVFYQLTFRFWELAAGVLLHLTGRRCLTLEGRWAALYAHAGGMGLGLVCLAFLLPRPEVYPWVRASLAVAGTVLIIGLPALPRGDAVHRLLARPSMLWIGQRSYALYLWHWPVYVLARWTTGLNVWPFNALALLLSVALAALSYRVVENPIRHNLALRRLRPRARITLLVGVLALGWLGGHTLLEHQPALGLGQPTRQAADWYGDRRLLATVRASQRRCEPRVERSRVGDATDALTAFIPDACPGHEARPQLFVLGDSHATAYLPLLEQLSAEHGRTVKVLQVPGCSYVNLLAPMDPGLDARCHGLAEASLRTVVAQSRRGDIVFLASLRLPRLIELGGARRQAPVAGDVHARSAQELAATRAAAHDASRWLEPLLARGLHVVLELPKPVLQAHPFQCVDWFNRDNPLCAGGLTERRADQARYRAPVVDAINGLIARHPGLSSWDPKGVLCGPQDCQALDGGRPLYFDGDHLSPYGNLRLLPAFSEHVLALELRAIRP